MDRAMNPFLFLVLLLGILLGWYAEIRHPGIFSSILWLP